MMRESERMSQHHPEPTTIWPPGFPLRPMFPVGFEPHDFDLMMVMYSISS